MWPFASRGSCSVETENIINGDSNSRGLVVVFDFLSGAYVPHGFEIILADNFLSPGSKGDIRNLWWNVQLTDDPRAWDEEIPSKNYSLRGERNDSKVWLVGCLLKTLKSNQR